MKLILRTAVRQTPPAVLAGFTRELFLALNPPLMPLRLLRFDGCKSGDEVHVLLGAGPLSTRWVSDIVEDGANADGAWFVDVGRILPLFLKSWRHRHAILNDQATGGSVIVDDIEYTCPLPGMATLLYPLLWAQFAWRRPVYRRYFG